MNPIASLLRGDDLARLVRDARSAVRARISLTVGHRLVLPRRGDQYLAAFPRSGSTWLRTVLTNVIEPNAHSNPDVFNQLIPGISIRNTPKIWRVNGPRIIMTHSWYQSTIHRALYLVRDGRDAVVSLYHYSGHYAERRHGKGRDDSFAQFLASYWRGGFGQTWESNVVSWLGRGKERLGNQLLVIRFEDLRRDTIGTVAKICDFFAINHRPDLIRGAVEEARLENMREMERSRLGDPGDANKSFYRGGASGQWRDYFTPALEAEFRRRVMPAMELAGYRWEST